jgi:hypothetical protein
MAKKIYFVKAKFQTHIELTNDYDADEKKEVVEAINYLPQCEFEFGVGDDLLPLGGTGSFCQGQISSKIVGKLHQVSFDGWFNIDPKKRRDKVEEKMEKLIKGEAKLVFKNLRAGSFNFNAANEKGKEVESLPTEFEITTDKPNGIEFTP